MANLHHLFFGPLDKGACIYFYILSFAFLLALLLLLIKEAIYIVKNYKTINSKIVINGILITFNIFIAYFVNRLMYTICNNSLS